MKCPILFKDKENCCGCAACFTVCPRRAISMIVDDEGFQYPHIDEKKCVNCKKCIYICPVKNADVLI